MVRSRATKPVTVTTTMAAMTTAFTAHANKIHRRSHAASPRRTRRTNTIANARKRYPFPSAKTVPRLVSVNNPQRHPEPWEYDGDEEGV